MPKAITAVLLLSIAGCVAAFYIGQIVPGIVLLVVSVGLGVYLFKTQKEAPD